MFWFDYGGAQFNGAPRAFFLFLFQDILKKNGLTYKGRIDMDDCTVIWLRDGEGKPSLNCFLIVHVLKNN